MKRQSHDGEATSKELTGRRTVPSYHDILGEEAFPAAPDKTKANPYQGMLTQADVNKNYKQVGRKVQRYSHLSSKSLQQAANSASIIIKAASIVPA